MGEKKSVLLVDDDEFIRMCVVAFLEDSGYQVFEAENGRQGVELFARERPDIVLTDLRMPVMNGFEVVTALKKISPATPVIVISGAGDAGELRELTGKGADAFMFKPIIDMRDLVTLVERLLKEARREGTGEEDG